jgi:hypothetical protein
LTSDGGIYKAAERSSGYAPDINEMMQPYAESLSAATAMATAASAAAAGGQASGAWGKAPTLRISALTSQPCLPFEVYIKELTGKTLALKVHEGMAFKEVKTMMLGRQGEWILGPGGHATSSNSIMVVKGWQSPLLFLA